MYIYINSSFGDTFIAIYSSYPPSLDRLLKLWTISWTTHSITLWLWLTPDMPSRRRWRFKFSLLLDTHLRTKYIYISDSRHFGHYIYCTIWTHKHIHTNIICMCVWSISWSSDACLYIIHLVLMGHAGWKCPLFLAFETLQLAKILPKVVLCYMQECVFLSLNITHMDIKTTYLLG